MSDHDYTDDLTLFADHSNLYINALWFVDLESSTIGLQVSRNKIKIQNLGLGQKLMASSSTVRAYKGSIEFIYLSYKHANSNSCPECVCRMDLEVAAVEDCNKLWTQR